MVVRPVGGLLCLTLQSDHARASGEVAAHWGGRHFARVEHHRRSVLLATAHHDAGWVDWERAPKLNPKARPYSFLEIPQVQHTQIYAQGVAALHRHDPYAALLVSLHGTGLYNGRYGHMPHIPVRPLDPGADGVVATFLADQKERQTALITLLQPDQTLLWTYYRWLQAWDGITLMMAMFDPQEERAFSQGVMPLTPGGSEVPLTLKGAGTDTWTLDPWPFIPDQLDLAWPVRYVEDRGYEGEAEFQEAFYAAATREQRVTLRPA